MTAPATGSDETVLEAVEPGLLRRLAGPYSLLRGHRSLGALFTAGSISSLVDWLAVVALCALAYRLTQSATLVALLTFTRLLPYVIVVPLAGVLTDRVDRRTSLIGATAGRAVCLLGLAFVQARSLLPLAFACVFAATLLSSLFRPALLASLPQAVGERELVEANALFSQVDMLSVGVGPVLAGILLAVGNERLAFLVGAIGLTGAALVLTRLPALLPTEPTSRERVSWTSEVLDGFRFLAGAERGVLWGVGVTLSGLSLANGAWWAIITVLVVRSFHLGGQGLGYLMAAYSVGGLISGLTVGEAARRRGVTLIFIAGAVVSSLGVAGVGLSPAGILPFLCLFAIGLADVPTKVIATTVIQTATPPQTLGRVVGALESGLMASMVVGSLIVGPLIATVGARLSAVYVGAAGLLLLAVSVPVLVRLEEGLGLRLFLQQVPVLSAVSMTLLEDLAGSFQLERVRKGQTIIEEGSEGDQFYLIKRGKVEVLSSQTLGREFRVATMGARDYFGEIALLRDVPRTATVRALSAVELYSLSRTAFQALLVQTEALAQAMRAGSTARDRNRQHVLRSALAYGPLGSGLGIAPLAPEVVPVTGEMTPVV